MVPLLLSLCFLIGLLALAFAGSWGPESSQQYSGYITVNTKKDNGGHIFYWMFESRSNPEKDPVILWMTGGPGCSSSLAVFYENGPYTFNSTNQVEINPFSWNEVANVIYVDQPVGTGFSYADHLDDYVRNEDQVGEDMYEFLQGFFKQYPKFKDAAFFVTGESYAGHYVPAVSSRILKGNLNKEGMSINLEGIAIGNGFVNAELQYPQYVRYAEDKNLIQNPAGRFIVEGETAVCTKMLEHKSKGAIAACNLIVPSVQEFGHNFNVYDIRKKCVGALCYDFSPLDDLMKQQDLRDALDVSPKAHWTECNKHVYESLAGDWILKCDKYIVPLLNYGISTLVYSGDQDFICNFYGGRAWTDALEWYGKQGFNAQNESDYYFNSEKSGTIKSYGPLTYLVISQAGHMVPMDQPELSLKMIDDFVHQRLLKEPISLFESSFESIA